MRMQLERYNVYFFFALLLGVSILAFMVFQPFLVAIFLAAILSVMFQRPYRFFLKITGDRERLSAFATSLLGVVLLASLLAMLLGLIVSEASNLYRDLAADGHFTERFVDPFVAKVNSSFFLEALGVGDLVSRQSIANAASQFSQSLISIAQSTYQGVAHFLFLSIVMFFTLYYMLVGGKDLVRRIMYLSPLKDTHEKILIDKFISISRATLKGTLVVGFVQGGIGGILFALVGIPSPAVWAVVMMFLSLIPMIGSSIIWFPAGIIMLLLGNFWQGLTILAVGLGIISLIDNFLRPELVGKDTQMHPLVVFFATLGGISIFGFLGFIIGPIIVALFLTLWDIYAIEFKRQLEKFNA